MPGRDAIKATDPVSRIDLNQKATRAWQQMDRLTQSGLPCRRVCAALTGHLVNVFCECVDVHMLIPKNLINVG